jgi:hypothetical protein
MAVRADGESLGEALPLDETNAHVFFVAGAPL